MADPELPLGRAVAIPQRYDPAQLVAIPRARGRAELALQGSPPFHGEDIWNAWEFAWLDDDGSPHTAVLELRVPADSPNLFESKSCKLYLFSWLNHRLGADAVEAQLAADLSAVAGAGVAVRLTPLGATMPVSAVGGALAPQGPSAAESLDRLCVTVPDGKPDAGWLRGEATPGVSLSLASDLFVSLCPVTGQPDWASVQIDVDGVEPDRPALLRYLLAFRHHQGFHEACCERIWLDLWRTLQPARLRVEMRFLRRGGIDINPVRDSEPAPAANRRAFRQ